MRDFIKAVFLLAPALARGVSLNPNFSIPSAYITLSPGGAYGRDLSFRLDIGNSKDACGYANVTINGEILPPGGRGSLALDDGDSIIANWVFTCVKWDDQPQEQLMNLNLEYVNNKPVSDDIGFTIRFQQVSPVWISDIEGAATITRVHKVKSDGHGSDDGSAVEEMGNSLEHQLAEFESLHNRLLKLQQAIQDKEQRLAETFGWTSQTTNQRKCQSLKCFLKSLYDSVKSTVTSHEMGAYGAKTDGVKSMSHITFPANGHSFPLHKIPHGHPPPFCRCKPPPDHHHPPPPPDEGRHHDHNGNAEHHYGSPPPAHGAGTGTPFHPPHGPPRFSPSHGAAHTFKVVVVPMLLLILLTFLILRCRRKHKSRSERRSRRRCRAPRCRLFMRRLFSRSHARGRYDDDCGAEEEGKDRLLDQDSDSDESEATMESTLASCIAAANVVEDMVAAEEGRSRMMVDERRDIQPRIGPADVPVSTPVPLDSQRPEEGKFAAHIPADDGPPAYEDALLQDSGVVSDGFRGCDEFNRYEPSSSGGSGGGWEDVGTKR